MAIHKSPGRRRPWARLSRGWKLILATVVAAATVAVPVGIANADISVNAKPAFKMPFACGQTFYANSWIGHSPNNTIDWQSYGSNNVDNKPVKASAAGTVTTVADRGNTSYGKYIIVTHSGGWTTLYAHLRSFAVSKGQKVTATTTLGRVGATGGVTGPHLHFEERLNGAVQTPVISGVSVPYGSKKALTSKNCGGGSGNPYTAPQVCGSGFKKIDSAPLKANGKKVGKVVLTYNATTKKNCVVTLKTTNLGKNTAVSAMLKVKGGTKATDSGKFGYYAGPVKKAAGGKCVKWGGSVGGASYTSPFEHCG